MALVLAPEVRFFDEEHIYTYRGKRLSGVTGLISKKLGLKMPQEFVEEYQETGIHVHKAVQNWIAVGKSGSIHPGVAWVIACFMGRRDDLYAEVLVSDFSRYASSVDVVDDCGNGEVQIYDIKTGKFKRDYCTWQLSVYKYLIEKFGGKKVTKCSVLAVKDKEVYDVFPKPDDTVEKLLYSSP